MFYVKSRIGEDITILTEITSENVVSACPSCGTEFVVDLADILSAGDMDIKEGPSRKLCKAP